MDRTLNSNCNGGFKHQLRKRKHSFTDSRISSNNVPLIETSSNVLNGNHLQEPLNRKLSITKLDTILLLLEFSNRHSLTSSATSDLIKLINIITDGNLSPNIIAKFYTEQAENYECTVICSKCQCNFIVQNGVSSSVCESCGTVIKTGNSEKFFITMNLELQLRRLLENNVNLQQAILERPTIDENNEFITDITSSSLYKRHANRGGILNSKHNFSLSFSTDGVSLYNSNTLSFWPIAVFINEVSPVQRWRHPLLAGLWFGSNDKQKSLQLFLKAFASQALHLENDGFDWKLKNGQSITSKVLVLLCVTDSIARPTVKNCVQFNGYFGCPWCEKRGEHIPGNQVKYHVTRGEANAENHSVRTHESTIRYAEIAIQNKKSHIGIKGKSPLCCLSNFDLTDGFPIDYMHAVLLGCAKSLTAAWLESNSDERYYIGSPRFLKIINCRLEAILPISEMGRFSNSITDRKFWKAQQWHCWLLYCSFICVHDLLPKPYVHNLSSLISAINLLLGNEISKKNIHEAKSLLKDFVLQAQELYGDKFITFNIHSLLHATDSVITSGPLWSTSMFPFENYFGILKKFVKGTVSAPFQIAKKVLGSSYIHELVEKVNPYDSVRNYIECASRQPNSKIEFSNEIRGENDLTRFARTNNNVFSTNEVIKLFERVSFYGDIFTSDCYNRSVKKRDSVCLLKSGEFALIKALVSVSSDITSCFIIYKVISVSKNRLLRNRYLGLSYNYISKIDKIEDNFQLCNISEVKCKCLLAKLENESNYIIKISHPLTLIH